jgi:hypothetical protein
MYIFVVRSYKYRHWISRKNETRVYLIRKID